MEKQTNLLLFLLLLFSISSISTEVLAKKGRHGHHHRDPAKLFVFGDSYADTGNSGKSSGSWKEPYGMTFPGKPAGRFSDGRVFTDYVASFLGIRSPVPFKWINIAKRSQLQYGINFAYGGTGVFDTLAKQPNMTTQIDFFEKLLIQDKMYTKHDLDSSVVLISVAGNDYATYIVTNGSLKDLPAFSKSLVKQLAKNLKRIHGLGVQKVAVTGLEPVGCLPLLTAQYSYQTCSKTFNSAAKFHNLILNREVRRLNNESDQKSVFIVFNLYKSFRSAMKRKQHEGSLEFKDALKPCCNGSSDGYSCGDVDDKGVKKYLVCKNPELSFFWDNLHPTQSGWHAVYTALKSSLRRLHH